MTVYELVNPSDPYTFEAPSLEVASLTVSLLGPLYGATSSNKEEENVPVFIGGGFDTWYQEKFGRMPIEGLDALKKETAAALESFVYGTIRARTIYMAAMNAIDDDEKRKSFIEIWEDQQSSLNCIQKKAKLISRMLNKEREQE